MSKILTNAEIMEEFNQGWSPKAVARLISSHDALRAEVEALKTGTAYSDLIHQRSVAFDEARDARAKLEIAVKALQNQPQVVYETLLEATAFMGIRKEKRENFIKERVENVKFIIDKALSQITERSTDDT